MISHLFKKDKNKRGVSMIFTLSIMLVLSIVGVTFVNIMKIEQYAADNYKSTVEARLVALAGVERAKAAIYEYLTDGNVTELKKLITRDVRYQGKSVDTIATSSVENERESLSLYKKTLGPVTNPYGASGYVGLRINNTDTTYFNTDLDPGVVGRESIGGTYETAGNFYSIKVSSNSGRFNVNSHIASTDGTSVTKTRQSQSDAVLTRIYGTLIDMCNSASGVSPNISAIDKTRILNALVADRNAGLVASTPHVSVNGRPARFHNMDDVVLAVENKGVANLNNENSAVRLFLSNLSTDTYPLDRLYPTFGGGVLSTCAGPHPPEELPTYYTEIRYPVNPNSASRELVVALLANIQGTAVFNIVSGSYTTDSDMSKQSGGGSGNLSSATAIGQTETPVQLTMNQSIAASLYDNILVRVINPTSGPKGFSDLYHFESTLDELVIGGFTFPGGQPSGVSTNEWRQAWVDMWKSNFNPNMIENYFNPNRPLKRRIAKGNLFGSAGIAHTTEFSFVQDTNYKVESVGWVVFDNYQTLISKEMAEVDLGFLVGVAEHSVQAHFEKDTSSFTNTHTYPINRLWAKAHDPNKPYTASVPYDPAKIFDVSSGGVEPRPINRTAVGSALYYSSAPDGGGYTRNSHGTFMPKFNASGEYPHESAIFVESRGGFTNDHPSMQSAIKSSLTKSTNTVKAIPLYTSGSRQAGARLNHLSHDGIVLRSLQTRSGATRTYKHFVEHAYSKNPVSSNIRGSNTQGDSNLGYYQGSIDMWVKLDEDARRANGKNNQSPPVALFSSTIQNAAVPILDNKEMTLNPAGKANEGVQMFAYIDTNGHLRVSRVYYGFVFWASGGSDNYYGITFDKNTDGPRGAGNRVLVRADLTATDSEDWRAGEWHSVRISWNDNNNSQLLYAAMDANNNIGTLFVPKLQGTDGLGTAVLNAYDPLDHFIIGGFHRNLVKTGDGIFRFTTKGNTVELTANATIDEVTTFSNYKAGRPFDDASTARFSGTSTYSNQIELGGFLGGETFLLGPVTWAGYSNKYTSPTSSSVSHVDLTGITGAVSVGDYRKATERGSRQNAHYILYPRGSKIIDNTSAGGVINYTFTFTSEQTATGGWICPSLDAVRFVFYSVYPQESGLKYNRQ